MTTQENQEQHFNACQAIGLSQAAFCCERGLNSKTFGNWLRTYREAQLRSQPAYMYWWRYTDCAGYRLFEAALLR
ncbi:MAG: hypothetical protein H6936_08160 [Burkholderiales bacterium]|nr:hypothetical protein [Nitrosomonas sp.]MCP5274811.1 hypothetical protein [Burkholderiales bacterium]